MPFARKVILHVPVSDDKLLENFVERCLADGVSIVAVVGPGCARIEDRLDEIIVGDEGDKTRFFVTTSHPNETLEGVLDMLEHWEIDRRDPIEQVWL